MEAHVLVLLLPSMYLSRRLPHLQARFLSHNMRLTETPTSQGLVRTGRDPQGCARPRPGCGRAGPEPGVWETHAFGDVRPAPTSEGAGRGLEWEATG